MRETLRRRVERHPLLWVAIASAAAVVVADGHAIAGAIGGGLLLILLLVAGQVRVAIAAMACAAAAGTLHGWRMVPQDGARKWIEAAQSQSARVKARVLSLPQATGGGWAALVEIRDGGPPGKVWWRGGGPAPGRGAVIEARGHFVPISPRRNPGEFDVAAWLHRSGAWGVFEAQGVAKMTGIPPLLERLGEQARAWFRDAVTTGLDPGGREAAVIRAMVLGENPADDDALIEVYRASGTLHVFSVSGMHVAMVGLIGWFVLKLLHVPRRPAVLLILLGMLAYAWITGMKPPATRSVTMAIVLLSGFLFRRRPDLLNALGLALLIAVIADGHLLFQAGVQLSFGVVFAIGIGTHFTRKWFEAMERREPYLPLPLYGRWRNGWLHFRQKLATALGASTAASIGATPLTLWHFGFLSPVSVIASPLIGIPVLALMSLALLAAALSPLPKLREKVNRANGWVARACTGIAAGAAWVPGGNLQVARDRPADDFLIIYDPGHGGGAACLHDDGSTVLLDIAHRPAFRRTLLPSLRYQALRPESLVVSHPDGGHLGGATEGLDALPIRQILSPVTRARSTAFRDLMTTAANRKVTVELGSEGGRYGVSRDTWLEVLHEPDPLDWSAVADERVMIVRLHWHGWKILFTSDAGWGTERAMLESGRDLRADVIVAGRHRHDSTLGDAFLAAVKPRAIIASHAHHPPEERVPQAWMEACEKTGIRVFHQGITGAVTVVQGKDGTLVIRGFMDGSELVLRR